MNQRTKTKTYLLATIVAGMTFFLGMAIYWTIVPFFQMRSLYEHLAINSAEDSLKFTQAKFIFEPWTYAQQLIRFDLLDFMLEQYRKENLTKENPIFLTAISRMEEYVAREPYFPNYFFMLGKAYDKRADLNNSSIEYYKKAEEYYREGLKINKYRQDGRYALAINLMNQGREEESRFLIDETLSQNDIAPETHYYVGLLEIKWKKPDYAKSLLHMEIALSQGVNPNKKITNQIYQSYFSYFYEKKDIGNFLTVLNRKKVLDPEQAQVYDAIAVYIEKNGKIPLINLIK